MTTIWKLWIMKLYLNERMTTVKFNYFHFFYFYECKQFQPYWNFFFFYTNAILIIQCFLLWKRKHFSKLNLCKKTRYLIQKILCYLRDLVNVFLGKAFLTKEKIQYINSETLSLWNKVLFSVIFCFCSWDLYAFFHTHILFYFVNVSKAKIPYLFMHFLPIIWPDICCRKWELRIF